MNPSLPKKPSKQRKLDKSDLKYEHDFKWLVVLDEGYYCSLCQKHESGSQIVWVDKPCIRRRRQSCVMHANSTMHKNNICNESLALAEETEGTGAIQKAFEEQINANQSAIIAQMKIVYWLLQEELPFTTKFQSLSNLVRDLGCAELSLLEVNEKAKYSSYRIIQDHVMCITDVVRNKILTEIRNSPVYSILIDETTDISVTKQMIVYAKYISLSDKMVKSAFLGLVALKDGKAITIHRELLAFIDSLHLLRENLVALGSDGANVMVGKENGVAALLRRTHPALINVHCIAHRLALAAGQASSSIKYLNKFKAIIQQLFLYYEYSAVRTAGLREIQEIMNEPVLKLKQAKDVRWLSHCNAILTLQRTFKAVTLSLSREASERSCATAAGLHKFVTTFDFIASIQMLSDILPHLNILSKLFQKEELDFSLVPPSIQATIDVLDQFMDEPGSNMKALLDGEMDALMDECGIKYSENEKEHFKTHVFYPFVQSVKKNLKNRFPLADVLQAFKIFDPSLLPSAKSSTVSTYGVDSLKILSDQFASCLPSKSDLSLEWEHARSVIIRSLREMSQSQIMTTLATKYMDILPNISKLAAIGAVIPVSTAECERGFSCLGRIKTISRNRLSNQVLQGLMMVSIHGPDAGDFDFQHAVQIWGRKRKRHILLEKSKKIAARNKHLKAAVEKSLLLRRITLTRKKRDELIRKIRERRTQKRNKD